MASEDEGAGKNDKGRASTNAHALVWTLVFGVELNGVYLTFA